MVLAVYQVEVTTQTGHYYRVERRYSAFHSLNKQCKKLGLGPTADFPPKRIRNTSAKVLESRRKELELQRQRDTLEDEKEDVMKDKERQVKENERCQKALENFEKSQSSAGTRKLPGGR